MQFKSILVPFDGSEPAKRAFQTAVQFAVDAEGTVLHVVRVLPSEDIPQWLGDPDPLMNAVQFQIFSSNQYDQIMDQLEQKARTELDSVVSALEEKLGNRIVTQVRVRSDVADGIVEYAEDNNIHLVIMGCRGLGGVRSLLGSVSSAVIKNLEIPVMIVK